MIKISCSKYSDLDDLVINKASESGLPLIGGTALEVWANYYNVPGVRKRSNNDLDFISDNLEQISDFQSWVRKNIDPSKVEVDVMHVRSHDFSEYIREVNGILIMAPEYLLWAKLVRPDRSQKDLTDIKWILSIDQMSDEDLSYALENLGVTDEEIELIESLL